MSHGCSVWATVCYTGGRCTGGDMYGCHISVDLGLRCAILEVGVQVRKCMDVTWLLLWGYGVLYWR